MKTSLPPARVSLLVVFQDFNCGDESQRGSGGLSALLMATASITFYDDDSAPREMMKYC